MPRIKNIIDYKIAMKLFSFSRQSWNNWKKEERPIVSLIENYFQENELEEFLETGKIKKLDLLSNYDINDIKSLLNSNDQDDMSKIKEKIYSLPQLDGSKISLLIFILKNHQFENKLNFIEHILNIKQSIFLTIIKSVFAKKGDIDRYILNKRVLISVANTFKHTWSENEISFLFENKKEILDFLFELSEDFII